MVLTHCMICPVQDKKVHIDFPADFPADTGEVEVIGLPLSPGERAKSNMATLEWLRDLWACAPDFPDRPAHLPPEPVEIP